MKTVILLPALAILFAALHANAAPTYETDWAGFDGGGGASQVGGVAHRGTIGGWLLLPMKSANYSGHSGNPAAPSPVQQPDVPTLHIVRVGNQVRISWEASAKFVLEQKPTLTGLSVWVETPGPISQSGGEAFVLVPAADPGAFYRLRSP